jgi:predicted MFS family arabinose efflux permease
LAPRRGIGQLALETPIAALAISSILARLSLGMGAVALVIFVHSRSGSFGVAGGAAAAFTLGFGVAGPIVGRAVDRRGPRPVLLPASLLSTASLLALTTVGAAAGDVVLIAFAALIGLSVPPVSGLLRRAWPALVEPDETGAAYLLDAILVEFVFISGPLLTGLLAATAGPAAPLQVAAVVSLLGTVWFLSTPTIAVLAGEPLEHRGRLGPLSSPTIGLLAFTGIAVGGSFGSFDVALPAFGVAHGSAGLGGGFIAALGVGSVLGALVYAAAGHRLGDLRQSTMRLAIAQPLLSVPLLFSSSVPLSVGLAMLAGSYAAPTLTLRNRVAALTMVPGTGTESFTWLLMSVMVGSSAGSALAGPLVAIGGWRLGVIAAIAIPTICLPVTLAARRLVPRH